MSAIENRRAFRDYYSQLLDNPEKGKSQDALKIINDTFKALGTLRANNKLTVDIEGKIIHVDELSEKELRIFEKFIEKFSQLSLPEKDVQMLTEEITSSRYMLGLHEWNRSYDAKITEINDHLIPSLDKARTQLLLHEEIEVSPKEGEDFFVVDAKDRLTALFIKEKANVNKFEKEVRDEKIKFGLKIAAGIGVGVLGLAAAVAAPFLLVAALISVAIFYTLAFVGAAIATGGLGAAWTTFSFLKQDEKPKIALEAASSRLYLLENYKKLLNEPGFKDFAENTINGYERLKQDDTTFLKFMNLYLMDKSYNQELLKIQAEIVKLNEEAEALGPLVEANLLEKSELLKSIERTKALENQKRAEVDKLRNDLELDPLPTPNL